MGRQTDPRNILIDNEELEELIATEDEFIRRKRLESPDINTQILLYPIWKIRSEYEDSLFPMQANVARVLCLQPQMSSGTRALREGNHAHPCFQLLLIESASCSRICTTYLMKLRGLVSRTLNLFYVMYERKGEMLEQFRSRCSRLQASEREELLNIYAQKIYYVLEMCLILREALMDSVSNGMTVLDCSIQNLQEASRFYVKLKIPLPQNLKVRNLMNDLMTKLKVGEDLDQDGDLEPLQVIPAVSSS